jgi:hypothetical protein
MPSSTCLAISIRGQNVSRRTTSAVLGRVADDRPAVHEPRVVDQDVDRAGMILDSSHVLITGASRGVGDGATCVAIERHKDTRPDHRITWYAGHRPTEDPKTHRST